MEPVSYTHLDVYKRQVLDLHKAYGYDFNNAGDKKKNILFTNKMVQKRFVNLWIKIAEHYANETHVAFELLNEVVEQENAEAWNLLIAETVDAIRRIARDTIIISVSYTHLDVYKRQSEIITSVKYPSYSPMTTGC